MVKTNNNIIENIKLAFQGIFSHKMRSFLTMLGIIIGIASIIAIVSTIRGTNEQIKENLVGSGTNTVTISPYQNDYEYTFDYNNPPDYLTPVSEETIQKIKDLKNVESVSRCLKREYVENVLYNNTSLSGATIYGIDIDGFKTNSLIATKGRLFTEDDYTLFRKVVVLDESASKTLFQTEDPIGKSIDIKGEVFTVIGEISKNSKYQPVINNIQDYYTYMNSSVGKLYIPSSAWSILYRFDEPESVIIKTTNTDSMTTVGKEAAKIVNDALGLSETDVEDGNKIIYKANDLLEQAKQIQELSNSTNTLLIWIAGISLLVGGIGVMNIMLVSVTERTREIGLKKALGARKKRILSQFLTEAAVLTSIGGILGVIVGIGLAYVIRFIASVPVAISTTAILVSVVFSALVGIIFGLLPSIKAANLDPIEALRYE